MGPLTGPLFGGRAIPLGLQLQLKTGKRYPLGDPAGDPPTVPAGHSHRGPAAGPNSPQMATLTFFLKEPAATRPTPIIARLAHAGTKTKIYTGESILPGNWIQAAQEANSRKLKDVATTLNGRLAGIRDTLLAAHSEHRAAGTLPTPEQLRQAIELQPAVPEAPAAVTDLLQLFGEWIVGRGATLAPNTLKSNRTTLRHLREFGERKGYALQFGSLDTALAERFKNYLLTDLSLLDSVVNKNLSILKNFLRWADEHGHAVEINTKKLRHKFEEPEIITLTRTELAALAALPLTTTPGLANARDLFLLSCYTGLRYSDVAALRPQNIADGRLVLTTQKTRQPLTIPLRPEARQLVARLLAGELRQGVSPQKLNAHLKTLGELAEIDTPTERVRFAGAERRKELKPKHEFITFHTGRRTFVTLALEAGLRPDVVMKITGHEDLKSFKRYVNVSRETVLDEFANVYGAA